MFLTWNDERFGSFLFLLYLFVENGSSFIRTAFLTWQNCLISPAVSPWIQMRVIYSRQWRLGHCWKSWIKQNIRWTHIHVGRGMNAYLLFVKCFSMLAHLFHQPWTFPLITHHATCWERFHQHVLFSWNRINETPHSCEHVIFSVHA